MTIAFGAVLGSDVFGATADQRHDLGTRELVDVRDSLGRPTSCDVIYVRASSALVAGRVYELPLNRASGAFVVGTAVTTTTSAALNTAVGLRYAVCTPLVAIPSGEYGWVAVKGVIPMFVGANAVARGILYTTATAGLVDDTDTGHRLTNVTPIVLVGGANAVVDVFAPQDLFIERT